MSPKIDPGHPDHIAEVVSVYDTRVDRNGPDSAHTAALELVGWNKRVLEVGCAGGHVTTALVDQGCTVVGIEIDPRVAVSAERFAERVVIGDIDAGEVWADPEGERFDVLLLGDVLEHLRDPLGALRRFVTYLEPDGVVVVSLPNIAHGDVRLALLDGTFTYRPTGLLDHTHLRFFTRRTALELLEQAGLVAVALRRIVVPLFASEVVVRRDSVDPSVAAAILEDPDAETYQFVFAAVRDTGDARLRSAMARLPHLEDKLRQAEIRLAVARAEAADETMATERFAGELEAARSHSEALERDAAERSARAKRVEVELEAATAELAALRATKTFRWSKGPRWLYGRLRFPDGPPS
jgi:2-polyprenyl-3-methyl-5-hydroxy-6-metoxy-1,4-benzoquinol methylase